MTEMIQVMEQNPFTFGAMITDPNRFIGRRAELAAIVDRLNGVQAQGSAVVGARRSGKSSLLHYLFQPRADETLRPPAGVPIVYLDAAAGQCGTPEQFRATLILKIIDQVSLDRRTTLGRELHEARQQIMATQACSWGMAGSILQQLPRPPIICLDEFESLLTEAFDDRFFSALRSWANEGLLNWVTASARPLQELQEQHGLTSPFFNLLATVRLGELTEAEASELLALADHSTQRFSEREKKKLRKIAGSNHPYHLQIVAWYLWRMKADSRVDFGLIRQALCQQPAPPPGCEKRRRPHTAWLIVCALLVIILLLLLALARQAPDFMRGVWEMGQGWFSAIVDSISNLGDFSSGVVVLVLLAGAIVSIIFLGKPVTQVLQQLWEKLK